MRITLPQRVAGGASLGLVLVIMAVSILVVGGVLHWVSTDSTLTHRLNHFEHSVVAAAAATEKVVAYIARDFQTLGETGVYSRLDQYRSMVPTSNEVLAAAGPSANLTLEDGGWGGYAFTDGQGQGGRTYVARLTEWAYTNLQTRFPGLAGYAATYRIVANARELNLPYDSIAAVRQDVQVAAVPAFQFQVFYGPDLEVHPSASLNLAGRVHCNNTIYSQPAQAVTFQNQVTASRKILNQKHPADPVSRTPGALYFQAPREVGVNTLNLPTGTNRTPASSRAIIEVPPPGEAITSALGQQRYYNKADMIILVSNTTVVAKSGAYNNFSVTIPWTNIEELVVITGSGRKHRRRYVTNVYDGIVSTNATFFNKRENKTVRCTEIDVSQLILKTSYLRSLLGRDVRTLYVADLRTQSASTESGVRLILGQTLPPLGLTVATPNPLYVQGHYNAPAGHLGTTNTSATVPASLVADAITLLSDEWADTNSTAALSLRAATNTTVNAAMLAGIVPTRNGYYSGGLENFPRLLEDWTGRPLTINGSMVALFESQIATAPWGASADVYAPPQRQWSFDFNFLDPTRSPPATPQLRTIVRASWDTIPANSIQ